MKKEYITPNVKVTYVSTDIITYSETDIWEGTMIPAGSSSPVNKSKCIEEIR